MRRINELAIKYLSKSEIIAIYKLVDNHEFSKSNKLSSALGKVTAISTIYNGHTEKFTEYNISILGFENCCKLFEGLCKQYAEFKFAEQEKGEIAALIILQTQTISISICGVNTNIGLCNCVKSIDKIINEYYKSLRKPEDRLELDEMIYKIRYKYAIFTIFSEIYYQLRDYIEGKTYFDNSFMAEYRKLDSNYLKKSNILLKQVSEEHENISKEDAKKYLLSILKKGITHLSKISLTEPPNLHSHKINKAPQNKHK